MNTNAFLVEVNSDLQLSPLEKEQLRQAVYNITKAGFLEREGGLSSTIAQKLSGLNIVSYFLKSDEIALKQVR